MREAVDVLGRLAALETELARLRTLVVDAPPGALSVSAAICNLPSWARSGRSSCSTFPTVSSANQKVKAFCNWPP